MNEDEKFVVDCEEFVADCEELSKKILAMIIEYPKAVGICVMPGLVAVLIKENGIPKEVAFSMVESALEDMEGVSE